MKLWKRSWEALNEREKISNLLSRDAKIFRMLVGDYLGHFNCSDLVKSSRREMKLMLCSDSKSLKVTHWNNQTFPRRFMQ